MIRRRSIPCIMCHRPLVVPRSWWWKRGRFTPAPICGNPRAVECARLSFAARGDSR